MNSQSQTGERRKMENTRPSKESGGIHNQKVALVTASTSGIGLAIARRLAQEGAHVVVSSRKQENVDKAVKQLQSENLRVTGITCHAAKAEDRERLVNTLFNVNVISTFLMVKLVVPHMKKRGSGSIVLISSIGAYITYDTIGPYCVSKTALLALTKALTPDLLAMNIRVNCVVPGLFKTDFSGVLWKEEKENSRVMAIHRFSRMAEPAECAGIVSFLCSTDASFISGENIVVAGGGLSRL
ncbi:dehydrogenase/reductase SDR family member 4-like isoform X2 [Lissotriton helveticus]